MPRTIALAHSLDDSRLPKETPMTTPAVAHHPHYLSAETQTTAYGTRINYRFRAFTGLEPEPKHLPYNPDMPRDEWRALADEYDVAYKLWNIARYRRELKPLLTAAETAWQEYTRAHKAMDATFHAFRDLPDSRWRAQTLQLVDAHTNARTAAKAFDAAAQKIADLTDTYRSRVSYDDLPYSEDVAKENGIDARAWHVSDSSDYRPSPYSFNPHTPLVGRLEEEIDRQRAQIKEVATLAGDPADNIR
ncbi:hypothetical protein [Streptomyces lavendofoliae]|uniref:Uncharacterized protein n=1 Tax=Streptomyces lavendofoliae TaxID=67314 RepID=A0A918I359_9ACTN|nr:hypothetical protein [Streptomyces lavendofoliae]GGU62602.1 hypothetical protein GCM10010274_59250 [Streptomyces lavendofoliae]